MSYATKNNNIWFLWVLLITFILAMSVVCRDDAKAGVGGTDVRVFDVFERADSVLLVHYVDTTADTVIWTDTTQVDTMVAEADLDTALHLFYIHVQYDGEWLTSAIIKYNNTIAGGVTAIPFHLKYQEADSSLFIIGVSSSEDTVASGTSSATDTTITGILDSLYTLTVVNLYSTDWITATSLAIDNRLGDTILYPAPAATSNYVAVYIDVGSGKIDTATGNMIPRSDAQLSMQLVGEPWITDGSWNIVPQYYQADPPDSNGRVFFYVPANTILTPLGSYYELTAETFDGWSVSKRVIGRYSFDTIPDPIDIVNATRVW